jgi:glucokinase
MPAATAPPFAVLEVGGSHVTGGLVDLAANDPLLRTTRLPLDSGGTAEEILATLVEVGRQLDVAPGTPWASAFPGPFDYDNGIGKFADVGKFDSLLDVDVREALAAGLDSEDWHFVNDADAFALGVWAAGSGEGRLVCLTLGTGVGSAFVADGVCVRSGPTVPPDAEMHLTLWNGKPLEETTSHRAIVGAYAAATGVVLPGVREVIERSAAGDAEATTALRTAFVSLGQAVTPWLQRFEATDLAFGGSVAQAWDVVRPLVSEGITPPLPRLSMVADGERAALIGAAFSARQVR